MNRKLSTLIVLMILAVCRISQAQHGHPPTPPLPPDPPTQPADLTADQVVAKSNAARGGEQKLKNIQSVRMTGTWETNMIGTSPIALTITPGHYLRRIEVKDQVMLKAVDGQTTWEVTPQLKIVKPTAMSDKEAARFRRLADPQGPLVNAKAKGNKIEMVGKMPWEGSTVYKLRVTFPDGGVNYVYVDAKSFLPVRVVNTMYVASVDQDVVIEFTYDDFRDVDGIKWPFSEKALAPDAHFTHSIAWKKIEVNKPVDQAAFKIPKT
jgi:hypothetical protein